LKGVPLLYRTAINQPNPHGDADHSGGIPAGFCSIAQRRLNTSMSEDVAAGAEFPLCC